MIDAHSHITICDDETQNIENINKYINDMRKNGINESIVTINPFIDIIKCKENSAHYVKMKNGNKPGEVICKCTVCKKIVYEGIDPFIKYNEYLTKALESYNNIHVYPVVSVTNTSTKYLIDYYMDKYGKKLSGIKAYTGLSAYSLDEIGKIKCDLPMLVHSGVYPNQCPSGMLDFIKHYEGTFQIAHLAGLDLETLKELKNIESVLVDISPAYYIYQYYCIQNNRGGVFNKDKIKSIDDMYELLLDSFIVERIVWGSDIPYSTLEQEISAVSNSKAFSESDKKKVLSTNIKRYIR